jgi:hypothetical protein
MLVEYAGKDRFEPPLDVSESKYLQRQSSQRSERAYRMFRAGRDTFYISTVMRAKEPTILRWITAERCKRLGLANPFGGGK